MPSYNPREDEAYFRYGEAETEGHYYYPDYNQISLSSYSTTNVVLHLMMLLVLMFLIAAVLSTIALVAELAEDYPSVSRSIMWVLIAVSTAAHIAMMAFDRLSIPASLLSLATNLVCTRLMTRFPFFPRFSHPLVLIAVALTVAESLSWLFVLRGLLIAHALTTVQAVLFMCFLWLVPMGFLCSAVPDSEQLPGARAGVGAGRSWSGARVASPRVVRRGEDGLFSEDLGRDPSDSQPFAYPQPTTPQTRQPPRKHQSMLGRLVRFIKNPTEQ